MVASDLLERLRRSGVHLRVNGEQLLATAESPLTEETRALIREHKPDLVSLVRRRRAILEYRFANDPAEHWYIMLGTPGDTYEETEAACRRMFPDVIETRPRGTEPPAGFPFSKR